MSTKKGPLIALVLSFVKKNNEIEYFVCHSHPAYNLKGSITFKPTKEIWREHRRPSVGMTVVLGDLVQTKKGWRAMNARIYRIFDKHLTVALEAYEKKESV